VHASWPCPFCPLHGYLHTVPRALLPPSGGQFCTDSEVGVRLGALTGARGSCSLDAKSQGARTCFYLGTEVLSAICTLVRVNSSPQFFSTWGHCLKSFAHP
jgi:hypothetical protein